MAKKPVLLCIMDGFGWVPGETYGNAVVAAKTPHLDALMAKYPMTTIEASGMAVGLPDGQMGNSEVGHLNIGAGRIVFQELSRINNAIKDGSIKENEVFVKAMDDVAATGKTLHLMGHKRVWPYRFEAQERALMGGMRGVGFSALLGLADFRKDALATALHVYYLQRKYPQAEFSLSCPRLRPIINNEKINPQDVGERQLCQILCAYRIFLPYVGITVSSRESAAFRNGIVKIAATKISAGVSTGIGDHEEKYTGKGEGETGDAQFEICDSRSLRRMYADMAGEGLQPVLNDYVYL